MILDCFSNINIQKVGFRFQFEYEDATTVGTMLSKNTVDFIAGEQKKIKVVLDTEHLTSGRYKVDIIAYALNTTGTEEFLDGVYPGLYLEIANPPLSKENPLYWLNGFWGNIHLHDVIVSEATE